MHRPSLREWIKAILLAAAFLFWSANQFWPTPSGDNLQRYRHLALRAGCFLVMIGWPAASPDEAFAETCSKPDNPPTHTDQSTR